VLLRREALASARTITLRRLADKAEETMTMDAWMEQLAHAHEGRRAVDGLEDAGGHRGNGGNGGTPTS
jgi:hypothetical protein